jgi:hypothetical protein
MKRACVSRIAATCFVFLGLAIDSGMPSVAAESSQQVHGTADVYSAPGVALAWGVLRGADEATTTVVVRIVADGSAFPWVGIIGSDPFSNRKQTLLATTRIDRGVDVRASRQQFGDFPRTEIRFYASASAVADDRPQLAVYFLGVPDTTPEFTTASALERYLADRIERARAAKGAP